MCILPILWYYSYWPLGTIQLPKSVSLVFAAVGTFAQFVQLPIQNLYELLRSCCHELLNSKFEHDRGKCNPTATRVRFWQLSESLRSSHQLCTRSGHSLQRHNRTCLGCPATQYKTCHNKASQAYPAHKYTNMYKYVKIKIPWPGPMYIYIYINPKWGFLN